jgi:UDP-galactopyranose mutase
MNIIFLSHLRFDSVTQRPQHIASELAAKHGQNVLFVEEPLEHESMTGKHIHIHYKHNNLAVFTPYMAWDTWDRMSDFYAKHLEHYMNMQESETLFWFYSPHYVKLLDYLHPDFVVYDCMDELSAFLHASPELPMHEKRLIRQADVVFTGGTSLYEKKSELHPMVFNFPSSVDSAHFTKGRQKKGTIPQDIAKITQPIAGYYGVIDERLDLELMATLADFNPDIAWVYIGPVVKINPNDLPVRPNIHYLGSKPYEQLPHYLKAIDVAIMPFAINKATQYISPTKTLEFMAAHKPIVSTPVRDVVRHYAQVVHVAQKPNHFYLKVEQALQETVVEKKKRITQQNQIIKKTSWSQTVVEMLAIINEHKQIATSQMATKYPLSW